MEHLQEILKVWADLHNKPSKSQNEKRIMEDLAVLLGRRCGESCLHKMRVVRAGGELEPTQHGKVWRDLSEEKAAKRIIDRTFKKVQKEVEQPPVNISRAIENAKVMGAAIDEINEIIDGMEEKKSPQFNADPVNAAEVKRGRKAKAKE